MPPVDKEMQLIAAAIRKLAGRTGGHGEVPMGRDITASPTGLLHGRMAPPGLRGPMPPEAGGIPIRPSGGYDLGRRGSYGPQRIRSNAGRGATSLDDVRSALLRMDPSLAGGVRPPGGPIPPVGAGPIPSSRSLMRVPPQTVPPGGGVPLGPSAAAAGLGIAGAAGLASPTGSDDQRPGPSGQQQIPNGPVYNTAGIPPNLISPRAEPRSVPQPMPVPDHAPLPISGPGSSSQPMPGQVPIPTPRPGSAPPGFIPTPRPRPQMHPQHAKMVAEAAAKAEPSVQSILNELFRGPVDRYGRRFEPVPGGEGL